MAQQNKKSKRKNKSVGRGKMRTERPFPSFLERLFDAIR